MKGIYAILNTLTNKSYIGSSNNINGRITNHFYNLRKNHHTSRKLQNSFNKYGEEVFKSIVIYVADTDEHLYEIEQLFLDKFDVYRSGYNMSPTAKGIRGIKFDDVHKAKMKVAQSKAKDKKILTAIITKRSIPIVQLSLTGEFIKEWPSSAEIARQLGGKDSDTTRVCKKKSVTAKGFKWVYAEEYHRIVSEEGEWIDSKHYRNTVRGLHMKGRTLTKEHKDNIGKGLKNSVRYSK